MKSEERRTRERIFKKGSYGRTAGALHTSPSSDGGGGAEGEQGSTYQETFSRVESDAKCMEARFRSAVTGWPRNIGRTEDPEDHPATDKGREGSWESKTNDGLSKMETTRRRVGARRSLEVQVNLSGCEVAQGCVSELKSPCEVFAGDVSIGRLWRHPSFRSTSQCQERQQTPLVFGPAGFSRWAEPDPRLWSLLASTCSQAVAFPCPRSVRAVGSGEAG